MNIKFNTLLTTLAFSVISQISFAQNTNPHDTTYHQPVKIVRPLSESLEKGIKFATHDESFEMHLRFRFQARAGFSELEDGDSWKFTGIESRIRRARLRLDGFVLTKKLEYHIQLSFSRGDMDWDNTGVPNVLRDAYCIYKVNPKFEIVFGQTKLPGNRQRVISSGDQQFVDRSIVNATYNIDRDFLLMFKYNNKLGVDYNIKAAVSGGEGRNSNVGNGGACYSGRVEILPLGKFTEGGDYIESDQEREPKPKISLAAGASFNDQAVRTAGQLGKDFKNPVSLTVYHSDLLFKYKGISSYTEIMKRETNHVFPDINDKKIFITTGTGFMSQLGYLFENNFELAFRYANVIPEKDVYAVVPKLEEFTLCASKYFNNHNVKLQNDLTYGTSQNMLSKKYNSIGFTYRLQLQIAI